MFAVFINAHLVISLSWPFNLSQCRILASFVSSVCLFITSSIALFYLLSLFVHVFQYHQKFWQLYNLRHDSRFVSEPTFQLEKSKSPEICSIVKNAEKLSIWTNCIVIVFLLFVFFLYIHFGYIQNNTRYFNVVACFVETWC